MEKGESVYLEDVGIRDQTPRQIPFEKEFASGVLTRMAGELAKLVEKMGSNDRARDHRAYYIIAGKPSQDLETFFPLIGLTGVDRAVYLGERVDIEEGEEKMWPLQSKERILDSVRTGGFPGLTQEIANIVLLTGKWPLDTALWKNEILTTLKKKIDEEVKLFHWPIAGRLTATYRVLRAYEIRHTPGKGIEIIDERPKEFGERVKAPLPEIRKF